MYLQSKKTCVMLVNMIVNQGVANQCIDIYRVLGSCPGGVWALTGDQGWWRSGRKD